MVNVSLETVCVARLDRGGRCGRIGYEAKYALIKLSNVVGVGLLGFRFFDPHCLFLCHDGRPPQPA